MKVESLEVVIEEGWVRLSDMPPGTSKTLFLLERDDGSFAIVGFVFVEFPAPRRHEIGTYTRTATLQQFREDVFFVFDQVKGRRAA